MDVYGRFIEKYGEFTDIQKKVIPSVKEGKNCLVVSPTGSGKTESVMLPLIDKVAREGKNGISVLYITPLRALNRDMLKRLTDTCAYFDVSVSVRHGDTTQSERAKQARKAPQILITTPETLQSMLPTIYMGKALANVKHVVVDEIHEFYYSKRGAQLSLGLERLVEIAGEFQRIGLSATVGDVGSITKFLCGERKCEVISSRSSKRLDIEVKLPVRLNMNEDMKRFSEAFELDKKSLARMSTITMYVKRSKSCLIFANTRQIVEAVGSRLLYLNNLGSFGGIGVHHGSLHRNERISLEDDFKKGIIKSVIATSSLELGIDIGNIDLVVQYGSPRQALRLLQRVGRSGHSVHKASRGAVICTGVMDFIEAVATVRNAVSGTLENFPVHSNALDVLANQICGIALDVGQIKVEKIVQIVRRSALYSSISHGSVRRLVEFMVEHRMIGMDKDIVLKNRKTRFYYYGHLSVIPDRVRFKVQSTVNGKYISQLDEKFVVSSISESSVFITKGLPWRVISIDKDVISVEPCKDLGGAVPDWYGEDIPVSFDVAQKVLELTGSGSDSYLKESAEVEEMLEKQRGYFVPTIGKIDIERGADYSILHTFMGTRANELLSKVLGKLVTSELGRSVNIRSSPYLIFVEAGVEIDIKGILESVSAEDVRRIISHVLHDTDVFVYKLVEILKLFGIVDKEATVSKRSARKLMQMFVDTPAYDEADREILNNYFEFGVVEKLFGSIGSGSTTLQTYIFDEFSPLASAVLNSDYYIRELIMPRRPDEALLNSFVEFVTSKKINLLCTFCGFRFTRKVTDIKDEHEIKCLNCGSKMISTDKEEYETIVKKVKEGKRIPKSMSGERRDMLVEARLFSTYGGKAAVALSTYGVGPRTAAKTLKMFREENKSFYTDLIDAQRRFIKNRKYWTVQ